MQNAEGIILNIFNFWKSDFICDAVFPHGLMKSFKNGVLWKSKLGRFLYEVLAIIRIISGWPFPPRQ